MDCKTARQIITLYASQDVDEAEAQMLREHLNCCQKCARLLESYRANIALLASLSEEEAPSGTFEDFYSRLSEKIASSEAFAPRRSALRRTLITAVRAVSVAAVILIALFIWFKAGEHKEGVPEAAKGQAKSSVLRVEEIKTVEPVAEEVLVPREKTGGIEMEECELLSERSGGSDF